MAKAFRLTNVEVERWFLREWEVTMGDEMLAAVIAAYEERPVRKCSRLGETCRRR
jgi:hypothetical protein